MSTLKKIFFFFLVMAVIKIRGKEEVLPLSLKIYFAEAFHRANFPPPSTNRFKAPIYKKDLTRGGRGSSTLDLRKYKIKEKNRQQCCSSYRQSRPPPLRQKKKSPFLKCMAKGEGLQRKTENKLQVIADQEKIESIVSSFSSMNSSRARSASRSFG